MIKATELRIGNKIKIGNVITTVTGGHLDYCGDKTEVKEFYPIPLTPEILEKVGFVMKSNYHPEGPCYDVKSNNIKITIVPLYHFIDLYKSDFDYY